MGKMRSARPCAETADEDIPFEMDKIVAALKPSTEREGCKVMQERPDRIECLSNRNHASSKSNDDD